MERQKISKNVLASEMLATKALQLSVSTLTLLLLTQRKGYPFVFGQCLQLFIRYPPFVGSSNISILQDMENYLFAEKQFQISYYPMIINRVFPTVQSTPQHTPAHICLIIKFCVKGEINYLCFRKLK